MDKQPDRQTGRMQVNLRLEPDEWLLLKRRAEAEHRTVTGMVKHLILIGLRK